MPKKIKHLKNKKETSLVKNTKNSDKIKTNEPFKGDIFFKLDNINFESVKSNKGFTNYLKDIFETHDCFVLLFDKFFKHMKNKKIGEIHKENHYHQIEGEKEKFCREIVKKIRNKEVSEDAEFFQFGIEGLRIITQKINNVYDILFLDPHHLIYSNKHYNQNDYKNYNCCMINLNKETNNTKSELEKLKEENRRLKEEIRKYQELLDEQTS